jgi:hypothetical protein
VWSYYGLSAEEAQAAGMNSQMFNSFLDGTKSAIEMAAVANACSLDVPEDGLSGFRHAGPTNSLKSWVQQSGRPRPDRGSWRSSRPCGGTARQWSATSAGASM